MASQNISASRSKTSKRPIASRNAAKRSPSKALAKTPVEDDRRYFNRELSWIEFNRHVLDEATDDSQLLLERLKFLSIFSTNLDEFFMIRVSGLKEQIAENIASYSPDGMSADEQIEAIYAALQPMLDRQAEYLRETIIPGLAAAGITIEPYATLDAKEKKKLDKYFRDNIFPILTPQSVDSSHPFPYISNLSINLGLYIEPGNKEMPSNLRALFRQKRFARIKLPPSVPRLIKIGEKGKRHVLLEQLISANVADLFPNMTTSEPFLFRVTRDADIELREDEAGDLMRSLESELQRRSDRFPVRLEVSAKMPEKMVKLLTTGIGLNDEDVFKIDGFVDIPDLMQLYSLPVPRLKDKPFVNIPIRALKDGADVFEVLKKQDILLHHPFTSFSTVTDLVARSAEDPDVQAIKICLYRTGKDSPIVDSLIRAVRMGKQVTALVELKARFDEENNIEWARRLENEGVHVVYGISTLKTHSKVMLIIRREKDKLRRYVHIATGNYNPTTARVYTDLGVMTSDEQIGTDATLLFNFLTGYSQQDGYEKMSVAPINLREKITELIRKEAANKAAKKPARIIIKINSLTDRQMVEELYSASQAGVEIDLIVRGICILRPNVPGLSENIRVRSIVGRFLEHSRIFWFENGGNPEVYIGSADLMSRNLDRRIEVMVQIVDAQIRDYLKEVVLGNYLKDEANARILRSDGTYKRVSNRTGKHFDAQAKFTTAELPI